MAAFRGDLPGVSPTVGSASVAKNLVLPRLSFDVALHVVLGV